MSEQIVAIVAIVGTLMWWSLLLIPWRPWQTSEKIEPDVIGASPLLNDITVIIPARNESKYIRQTLQALHKQGESVNVIVVDDQSADDTATQAEKYGARVITGRTPPVGWSGKLWALEQGLQEVRTPYVLLLDADIELMPGMMAALKVKAQQEKLALVSIMAQPPLAGFVERLLMPPFIYFFKLLYPFSLANKPKSHVAAAAGGCILVKTGALRAVGAFSSLHDALIDDCTLAVRIKQAGLKTWIGLSHSARIHRGYHNLKSIWEMVARTAYTQLQYSPVLLGVCTMVMGSMFWVAPFAPLVLPGTMAFLISALAWIAMLTTFSPTLVYYRRSLFWGMTLPIAGTLYLAMTWTSALRYWRGERANWKDRRYESKPHH